MTDRTVDTPLGPGRLVVDAANEPRAVLLLGHGAGGGVEAFDLASLAEVLPGRGVTVVRYEQPWRTAGKRVAPAPAALDKGWEPAVAAVLDAFPGLPLVGGGRSAGARVACRGFTPPAVGVVCLSFPLHPPGKPERSRSGELAAVSGPVLVVQGVADPFGTPDEVRAALSAAGRNLEVVSIPGATHSFEPRTKAAKMEAATLVESLVAPIAAFVAGLTPTLGPTYS